MEINEKAKMMLLGENCACCKHLEQHILNPSEIDYVKIDDHWLKIQPQSLTLKFYCNLHDMDIKSDPTIHVCDKWVEEKNKGFVIPLSKLHI